ncbi:MAG: hypothetical protein AAGA10_24345 [Bacteroidota bacterium]
MILTKAITPVIVWEGGGLCVLQIPPNGQKVYALINIGRLGIGIAACILIALFIQDELRSLKQIESTGF